jgi:hypothetical protein
VVVAVVMALLRTDVVHLVGGATLRTALDWTVLGHGEPDDNVAISRVASAAQVALLAEGLDGDGVFERPYPTIAISTRTRQRVDATCGAYCIE